MGPNPTEAPDEGEGLKPRVLVSLRTRRGVRMALAPPCPLSDFFGSLAGYAGPGGHPVDNNILPYNRPRGCRVLLKAAGRNGRT
jgi:hypothetical protein